MIGLVAFRGPVAFAFAIALAVLSNILVASAEVPDSREVIDLASDWRFAQGDPHGAEQLGFDDNAWQVVNVPHDWSIVGPKAKSSPGGNRVGYFPSGIGWYRKQLQLPEDWTGHKVFVQFDGVYRDSQVWINGHLLGRRPNGYASFEYDLTPHVLNDGPNVLAVRVDNSAQPNSRWYTGSGIYRNVRMVLTSPLHVAHWGVSITTPEVTTNRALVQIKTDVVNNREMAAEARVTTTIISPSGDILATDTSAKLAIAASANGDISQQLEIRSPKLWSPQTPELYQAKSELSVAGKVVDVVWTTFGVRSVRFDKDRGFLLNDRHVEMKGVNLHHDAGPLGAAVPVQAWQRRLEILKSIGCNSIRTSHNPPAPELLDLCDRMGFLVVDEAFDKWGKPYNRSFNEWGHRDLVDMIRRDRNHPCVVLWSVGNELGNQGSPEYLKQLDELVAWTRQADPTRQVTVALRPFKAKSHASNAQKVTEIARRVDVISCNYQEQWFEDYRSAYPEIVILASEIYPYYRGKGLSYKAFHPQNPFLDAIKHDYVVGGFYWTGIDYLGEAVAGWPYHGWNCSLIDTTGAVRPVGRLAQSLWSDAPMVHIAVMDQSLDVAAPTKDHWGWPKMASHWNLSKSPGETVRVATYTNCPEVELLVNGQSVGVKSLKDYPDRVITWDVPYEPGRIEARGLKQGHLEANHQLSTAGVPVRVRLTPDRQGIKANGKDLCYVDVEVVDAQGNLVPTANHRFQFYVSGAGSLAGVDNGDLTSMEPYKSDSRSAVYGRAQAILQSGRTAGDLILRVEAKGLPEAQVTLQVK